MTNTGTDEIELRRVVGNMAWHPVWGLPNYRKWFSPVGREERELISPGGWFFPNKGRFFFFCWMCVFCSFLFSPFFSWGRPPRLRAHRGPSLTPAKDLEAWASGASVRGHAFTRPRRFAADPRARCVLGIFGDPGLLVEGTPCSWR